MNDARVSISLDLDQVRHFAGPDLSDLVPKYMQHYQDWRR